MPGVRGVAQEATAGRNKEVSIFTEVLEVDPGTAAEREEKDTRITTEVDPGAAAGTEAQAHR